MFKLQLMAELKTKPTDASVKDFLAAVEPAQKREDCKKIADLMERVTGEKPIMWGDAIIGYGTYKYQGKSSSGDWFSAGLSPRKANITVYLMGGFKNFPEILERLGKYKTGGGCLYINKLADVNTDVLAELVTATVKRIRENNQ